MCIIYRSQKIKTRGSWSQTFTWDEKKNLGEPLLYFSKIEKQNKGMFKVKKMHIAQIITDKNACVFKNTIHVLEERLASKMFPSYFWIVVFRSAGLFVWNWSVVALYVYGRLSPVLQWKAGQLCVVVDPLELQWPAALGHTRKHQPVALQM